MTHRGELSSRNNGSPHRPRVSASYSRDLHTCRRIVPEGPCPSPRQRARPSRARTPTPRPRSRPHSRARSHSRPRPRPRPRPLPRPLPDPPNQSRHPRHPPTYPMAKQASTLFIRCNLVSYDRSVGERSVGGSPANQMFETSQCQELGVDCGIHEDSQWMSWRCGESGADSADRVIIGGGWVQSLHFVHAEVGDGVGTSIRAE